MLAFTNHFFDMEGIFLDYKLKKVYYLTFRNILHMKAFEYFYQLLVL